MIEPARRGWFARPILWILPASAVTAAALLFTVIPAGRVETQNRAPSPKLRVYRVRNGALTILNAASQVRPGDSLQLAYIAGGAQYGAVVSLDGGGAAVVQFPETGGEAQPLQAKGEVPLPNSLQVSAAPVFERYVLITANAPFPAATALAAAQKVAAEAGSSTAALTLPDGLAQTSVVLQKIAP
ncbi:MAG TPA: hypothetical protein VH083_12620 [Myxococcales bacterium]|jgi:hypothetical protein|nr:hypothetical protein [Myxococcales bacterium]